jgi:glyoxylase-like metal-dependent hydrolase (beta-lactamase superfamily II)
MGLYFPQFRSHRYKVHTLQTGSFKENCYIVVDINGTNAVIIDPGAEANYLKTEIDSLGVNINMILLTHGHFDHIGAVENLANYYGVLVHAHQIEKALIRQAGIYAYRFNKERLIPPVNITYFDECQDLYWPGGVITTIPCPGHTAGCVSYGFESEIVFTGDTLFRGYVGPTNYPTSNYHDLINSVESLLANLPPDCIIFPGHGRSWLAGDATVWWKGISNNPPQFHLFGDDKGG